MNSWSSTAVTETLMGVLKDITTEAQSILPDFPPETIHKFRVATKRLRALLRLLETQDEAAAVSLPKPFRQLYRYSGAVRDAQVLLGRATTACDPPLPDYTVWLAQQMADAQTEYTAFYDAKILKKLEKKLQKLDVPAITVATLEGFFRHRLEETETLLQQEHLEDEDLHTVRKRVKDLQHIAKICSEAWPEGLEALGDMGSLNELEKVADLAGDYNDQAVALRSLDEYLSVADKPKKTVKVLERWTEAKDTDQRTLLQAIADFRTAATGAGKRGRKTGK